MESDEDLNISLDAIFCILTAVYYTADGSVGVSGGHMKVIRFSFVTGEGFNLICRDALPYGWDNHVDDGVTLQRFYDANGKLLDLRELVWLTKNFVNAVLRIRYIFSEGLEVHSIIEKSFLNRHLVFIR